MRLVPELAKEIGKLVEHRQAMEKHSNIRQIIYRDLKVAEVNNLHPNSVSQFPLDKINQVAKHHRLVYFPVYLDPPRYLLENVGPRKKIFDEFGRLLYMAPPRIPKKIRAEDFAPLPEFPPVYPPHPDPDHATPEEKRDRILMYLDMYSMSGLIIPSAKAVGVSYPRLVMWINESVEFQSMSIMSVEAAKIVLLDVGRARAMQGDSGLLRFFIEQDNPEMRKSGSGGRRNPGELPEGVTQEAIAKALGHVKAAEEINAARVLPPPGAGENGEMMGYEGLIVNDAQSIQDLVNQTSRTIDAQLPASQAYSDDEQRAPEIKEFTTRNYSRSERDGS